MKKPTELTKGIACLQNSIILPKTKRKVFLVAAMIATGFTVAARAADVCEDGCFF